MVRREEGLGNGYFTAQLTAKLDVPYITTQTPAPPTKVISAKAKTICITRLTIRVESNSVDQLDHIPGFSLDLDWICFNLLGDRQSDRIPRIFGGSR